MNGILVDDFISIISNSSAKFDEISDAINNVRSSSYELRRTIRVSELSYLTDLIYENALELNKIRPTLKGYITTLKRVLRQYEQIDSKIASKSSQMTPKIITK